MKKYETMGTRQGEQGFTLIELSIVLVIIGLIVGGVLVGQDLIRAAEIRATVTQIEKYNTAVNTFRGKYNGIPGDLAYASASAFGLGTAVSGPLTNGGNAGLGDGNGLIDGGAATTVAFIGEPVMFWNQMSIAGYTDGSFGTGMTATTAAPTAIASVASADLFMPAAKMGRGSSVNVAENSGINYFMIGGFGAGAAAIPATGVYANTQTNTLTPTEAYNIDKKTDDGLPGSGSIMAMDLTAALTYTTLGNAGTASSGGPLAACTSTNGTSGVAGGTNYFLSGTNGTTQGCSLRLRFN